MRKSVTMLGHRALGDRLKTVFIENGLMREGEAEKVAGLFKRLGVTVDVIDAKNEFFAALQDVADPEEKREAITQTFYKDVFGRLVKGSGAKHLRPFTKMYSDVSSKKVVQNTFFKGPY
jgi:GMP synthase (glutamine-hydrolysing)